ncbi:MAG: GNAT family N-acetyltransferase [Armatimonadetes bacterium]|nr:GNAT family N-acetyltransferase [Armatimonadota bacterium]
MSALEGLPLLETHDRTGVPLKIRIALQSEAATVMAVMTRAFAVYAGQLEPEPGALRETLKDVELAMREGGAILAECAGIHCGSARFAAEANHLYTGRISVLPEFQHRGIATRMLEYLATVAQRLGLQEIRLSSRSTLPQNVAFYLARGFEIVERVPHDAAPHVDVVKFRRRLTPE